MTLQKSNAPPPPLAETAPNLPAYLRATEPMEIEALPLQLALLTMEVAAQREALQRLSAVLNYAATMVRPADPLGGLDDA